MKTRQALAMGGAVIWSVAFAWAEDSASYFRAEDAADYTAAVASITDVQHGDLYTMTWQGDYHLDRVLAAQCQNSMQLFSVLSTQMLNDAPLPTIVTGALCSAFAAQTQEGDKLVGRNFDYRYPMAHALLFTPKDVAAGRTYASVGTVDAGFAGFDVGSLSNVTDQTKSDYPWNATLFPYLCMDGMNEAGFMVTVLSLDQRTGENGAIIEQFVPGHTNVVPSLAIRYLLDRAGSTEEGVNLMTNFNMFASSGPGLPVQANYHFLLSDRSGDSRVVEWLPPAQKGESWIPFVTNATEVTNFYLADGYGHGSNRWEILRHALACREHVVSEDEAMTLCRAASQKKGAEQTSWTHWSVVYNLTDLTANIATLGNYDEITPFSITSDAMTVGAAKSARPPIETDLPAFNSRSCQSGKVYVRVEDSLSSFQRESKALSGAGVSSVNRAGCTCDSTEAICSRIVKSYFDYNRALIYVASPLADASLPTWTDDALAGVNSQGVSARVVKFRNSIATSDLPAAHALCRALSNCTGASASDYVSYLEGLFPYTAGTGVVFTDVKGNVAVWPAGSELATDDASEMFRNSLDLRKGIYEIEGTGLGQFDELPGLLRLASSTNTKAVVSMGYGRLDVVLPETNLVWRAEIADANIPHYGIVADPPAVAHATMSALTSADGSAIERNNQGRLIAQVGAELKVSYTAESGYYFANGTNQVTLTFAASEPTTIPPTETPGQPKLQLAFVAQRYPWNGIFDVKYRATYWPVGGQGAVEITLDGQTVTKDIEINGTGTVKGAVAIDLREIFPEARGEATFRAVVK